MGFNRSGFTWPGRQKHPPPDPINALLSLTYTLVMHELLGLLEAAGLDPYLGFLHQLEHGRPSLALDLLEAFRHPVADRFVLALLNQAILAEKDFRPADDYPGMALTREAAGRYFPEYEKGMLAAPGGRPSFRASLKAEVEMLARHFCDGSPWTPYDSGAAVEEEACTPHST
jgi:CRISPR-associated protein Cas1